MEIKLSKAEVIAGCLGSMAEVMPEEAAFIRAHIAALEAERDEGWKRLERLDGVTGEVQRERDALRERVQALEADLQAQTEVGVRESTEASAARIRAQEAEHTLAAIRQRAGDKEALRRAALRAPPVEGALLRSEEIADAVARYVVGEDATKELRGDEALSPVTPADVALARKALGLPPASPEPSTSEAFSERAMSKALEKHGPALESACKAPQPSTAEAFATLNEAAIELESCAVSLKSDALKHLGVAARDAASLLERRMGAMGLVLRRAVEDPGCMDERWLADAQAALTDAPRVYTEAEVEALAQEHCTPGDASRLVRALAALRNG